MTDEVRIEQAQPDHHYRSETPNIVFKLGLSIQAIGLYSYYKMIAGDGGACWKKQSNICQELGLSAATYIKYRDELAKPQEMLNGKPLISVFTRKKEDGSNDTTVITVVDIWRENGDHFRSKKKVCHSNIERGVIQNLNEGHSKSEYKQEPFNKNRTVCSVLSIKTKFCFKGCPSFELSDDELYHKIVTEKVDWSEDEIAYAKETLGNYQGNINDWWKFLSGVVQNYRNKKASESKTYRSQKSHTQNRSKTKCKSTITKNKTHSKNDYSESDTKKQPWHDWKPLSYYLEESSNG